MMKLACVAILTLAAPITTVAAEPILTSTTEPEAKPATTVDTKPDEAKPDSALAPTPVTAATVAGSPQPGFESGRTDEVDPGDSAFRWIARGALFVPRWALEVVLSPIRGGVWAEDKYHLHEVYSRIFFNDAKTMGLYPTGMYESGFGASIGARFVHRNLFGEHEHVALQATTGAMTGQTYRAGVRGEVRTGNRLGPLELAFDGNFDQRPTDPFFGIGNGNLVAMPPATRIDPRIDNTAISTNHRYQEASAALGATIHLPADLHVVGSAQLTELQFAPSTSSPNLPIDQVYDTAGLVGFTTGVHHAYGELELRWDTRRRYSVWEPRSVPSSGSLVSAFVGRIEGFGSNANFSRYGVELQNYLRIAKGPRVLVTRFHGEAVTGSLDQVPFTELPMLGGGSFLRGYSFERFRDRVAAFGSLQYEWDLSHLLHAYVFTDVGRVFPSIADATYHDLRVGYGLGVELHSEQGFMLETSIASSIDGGVLFSVDFNPVLDARARWR